MDQIGKSLPQIEQLTQNGSTSITKSSASTPPRRNLGISREKITAMLNVLNKRWLTQGWRVMDKADAEIMAIAWIEVLDQYKVPHDQYAELYRRCLELRSRRLSNGLKCEDFSAELMVASWIGEHGLRAELRQRQIDERRSLPATAESDCERCYGSGIEVTGRGARVCACRK